MKGWLKAFAIVALAMAGCDDGDDPVNDNDMTVGEGGAGGGEGGVGGGEGGAGGGEGGAGGGEGGAGGGEGGAGGGGEECAGIDLQDLNADGANADGVWTLDVSTSGDDNFSGSCQAAEAPAGGDVMIKFVPPEGGLWLFTANVDGAPAANTLMYAYSDCNDAFSEASCQAGGRVALEVVADQPLYIVIDSAEGTDPLAVTFQAEVAQATAPVLDTAVGSYNVNNGQLGLRYEGTDPESDATGFIIDLFGEDGASLLMAPAPIELDTENDPDSLVQADGMFQGEIIFNLADFPPIAGVRLTMVDAFGLESNSIDIAPAAPEQVLELGAECNFAGVFEACMEADACALANPEDEAPVCIVATAPTVTEGSLYLNVEEGLIGIVITGQDPENNANAVSILPKDAEGNDLSLIEAGGAGVAGFSYVSNADGTYTGWSAVAYFNSCFPAAQAEFDACVAAGGDQDACVDQANAGLAECARETAAMVASADVAGVDATGKTGEFFTIEMVVDTPLVETGDNCDETAAIAICPEDNICFGRAAEGVHLTCGLPQLECFEDAPATVIDTAAAGPWVVQGDTSMAEANLAGVGSCGGGGNQVIYEFTAPAAGTYTATLSEIGEGDTLMYARTHCQLPGEEYELACNDDVMMGVVSSEIAIELEADQAAYIIIDSWEGDVRETEGPHTLTITAP